MLSDHEMMKKPASATGLLLFRRGSYWQIAAYFFINGLAHIDA